MVADRSEFESIVVLARPALGRRIEAVLRESRYSVFRTPDQEGLLRLVRSIRPSLVVICREADWGEAIISPESLAAHLHPVPVLFMGGPPLRLADEQGAWLSLPLDPQLLVETVDRLLRETTHRQLWIEKGPIPGA